MPGHDRARGRPLGGESLQAARPAHPVGRQPPDLGCDVRDDGRNGVVIRDVDPHHARGLRCTKAHREHRPEHERHLAEHVARVALAEDALDPLDEPDRLDATLEHGEERALIALVSREFAGREADVRRHARELLTLLRLESRE